MDRFSKACKEFALTISIKTTRVMTQDAEIPPSLYIDGSNLSVVDNFKYLGSTISSRMSLDVEINACIGKAATIAKQTKQKRVWQNITLTMNTSLRVYEACVASILLYISKTWTPYARVKAKLIHSICAASDEFWVSLGSTPLCWRRPNAQVYML